MIDLHKYFRRSTIHSTPMGLSASSCLSNASRPAATALLISCWPRLIVSLTWRRDCHTFSFALSIASKHFFATHFRVSSPDFGAKRTLRAAPIPIPAAKAHTAGLEVRSVRAIRVSSAPGWRSSPILFSARGRYMASGARTHHALPGYDDLELRGSVTRSCQTSR
jgi:hypothetical protein